MLYFFFLRSAAHRDLHSFPTRRSSDLLTKAFGGLLAVSRVSFDVAEGEILGLLGPNGSGKTTLLNLVAGALRADEGRVRLAGRDITCLPASVRTRLGIARTFQLVRPLSKL